MHLIIVYVRRADLSCQDHSLYPSPSPYVRTFPLLVSRVFKVEKRLQNLWTTASSVTTCMKLNLRQGESGRPCPWQDNSVSFRHYIQTLFGRSREHIISDGVQVLCVTGGGGQWQHDSKVFTGATSRSNTASLCDSNQIMRSSAHQQGTTARCGPSMSPNRQKCRLTFKSIDNEYNNMDFEWMRPKNTKLGTWSS
jgi:hypothetical protein